jgi:hypothetical protein
MEVIIAVSAALSMMIMSLAFQHYSFKKVIVAK